MASEIAVYADWIGCDGPQRLGMLHARRGAGPEVIEFEFDAAALTGRIPIGANLDPRLGPYTGRQHPEQGRDFFGIFADSSPDRWGRLLMKRRLERAQRAGFAPKSARLFESDYLLGVHDTYRSGALRFRLDDRGEFLDNRHEEAAPPLVKLRELEAASTALERDIDNTDAAGDQWLRMLIAPGGSLGGARPKASVVDPDGHLWIAKFPSVRDDYDVGAWELLVQSLATACGLQVTQSRALRFASEHHTFLVKRFDRSNGGRLHFASAMTLTDHVDGDDASSGASYLEIARVVMDHGYQASDDLRELWSRIVFNMLVSNTDDHLRNHGFILSPGRGWRLSPAYDMNPVAHSAGLKLNVSDSDNALDLELARSVAPYFRVPKDAADEIIDRLKSIVRQWRKIADSLKLSHREQEMMSSAFSLAEK